MDSPKEPSNRARITLIFVIFNNASLRVINLSFGCVAEKTVIRRVFARCMQA